MHDIFEGTVEGFSNDTLINICFDLIYIKKWFSFDFLNARLECISKDFNFDSNKIPIIKKEHTTQKKSLRCLHQK